MKTAALSIGNSNLSAAIVDGAAVLGKRSVPVLSLDEWPGLIDWIRDTGCPAAAVSLNPGAAFALEERYPAKLWIVGRDMPVRRESRLIPPRPSSRAFCATNTRAWSSFSAPSTRSHCRSASGTFRLATILV